MVGKIQLLQEVVIMSNACDLCGYRSSDIKAGGGVSEKGSHIILDVSEQADLRRDVIKAESASISIPEADLEVTTGTEPCLPVSGLQAPWGLTMTECAVSFAHM